MTESAYYRKGLSQPGEVSLVGFTGSHPLAEMQSITESQRDTFSAYLLGLYTLVMVSQRNSIHAQDENISENDSIYDQSETQKLREIISTLNHLERVMILQGDNRVKSIPINDQERTIKYAQELSIDNPLIAPTWEMIGSRLVDHINQLNIQLVGESETRVEHREVARTGDVDMFGSLIREFFYGMTRHELAEPLTALMGRQQYILHISKKLKKARSEMEEARKNNMDLVEYENKIVQLESSLDDFRTKVKESWESFGCVSQDIWETFEDPFSGNNEKASEWARMLQEDKTLTGRVHVVGVLDGWVKWASRWNRFFITNCMQNAKRAGATEVNIFVRESNDCMIIEVVDNGHGLLKEMHPNGVLTPGVHGYASEDSNQQSTGLATVIMCYVAEKYGGEFSCNNREGVSGAISRIVLPLVGEEETLTELVS